MKLLYKSMISILLHFPLDSSLHFAALMLQPSSFVDIYLSSAIWFWDSSYCWPAPRNFQGSFLMREEGSWIFHLSNATYTDGESNLCLLIECPLVLGEGLEALGNQVVVVIIIVYVRKEILIL